MGEVGYLITGVKDVRAAPRIEFCRLYLVHPAELLEHRDGGRVQGWFVAIADLDGKSLAPAFTRHDLHAVRAYLANPVATAGAHPGQVIAPRAADQVWVRRHGLAQQRKAVTKLCICCARGQARIAMGQASQRHGVIGRGAAIYAHGHILFLHAYRARHRAAYRSLQRVRKFGVVLYRPALLHTHCHKARVLTAAIVVPLVIDQTLGRRFVQQGEQARHMAAAAQHAVVLPGLGQNRLSGLHMHGLTVMAGAEQSQFGLR